MSMLARLISKRQGLKAETGRPNKQKQEGWDAMVLWAFLSCKISLLLVPRDLGSNPHGGNIKKYVLFILKYSSD